LFSSIKSFLTSMRVYRVDICSKAFAIKDADPNDISLKEDAYKIRLVIMSLSYKGDLVNFISGRKCFKVC